MTKILILVVFIGVAFIAGISFDDLRKESHDIESPHSLRTLDKSAENNVEQNIRLRHKNDQNADTLIDKKRPHSHHEHKRSNRSNKKFCLEQTENTPCVIDLSKVIVAEIFDHENGGVKAMEITSIISSVNYQDFLNHISTEKVTNDAFTRELKLNEVLNEVIANNIDISSSGILCNDDVCGLTAMYDDDKSIELMKKQLFASKNNIGNLFIANIKPENDGRKEMRAFFIPGYNGAVVKPLM